MSKSIQIGQAEVGPGCPCYVVAEIGINHNGDLATALDLIDVAVRCGCDAVKFQKRTPELFVPEDQWNVMRETRWGMMRTIEYRRQLELGQDDYEQINARCRHLEIPWFASCWDLPSVEFIEQFDPPAHKVASAMLTNDVLLKAICETGRPAILSTGMSTATEIHHAVVQLDGTQLVLLHCTSTYPCPSDEINLRMVVWLRGYHAPVGYSGHENGIAPTLAAVAMGACIVERHITPRRNMAGSDHNASLEPWDLARLVMEIRTIERAMGDGVKRVYKSELLARHKLRRRSV